MHRRILTFIALAITMIFGGTMALVGDDNRQTVAIAGGIVVALAWIAVSMFGEGDSGRD